MKNTKLFLTIIGIVGLILLLIDLPFSINLGKFSWNPSHIYLATGPVKLDTTFNYKLGLDLQGGTELTYKVDMSKIPKAEQDDAFAGARTVIERRVNFFGVSEPSIQTLKLANDYRIIVQLPGLSDVNQAISLIGQTAELSFWEKSTKPNPLPPQLLPYGIPQLFGSNSAQTQLTGKDLKNAQEVFDNSSGQPEVQLTLTPNGTKLFGQITSRNVGKPLAIVIDNVVIEAPTVNQAILTGTAIISGGFTSDTAKQLAVELNGGALPAPLQLIGQNTIGPSLGIQSLKDSLIGGIVGFLCIIIFMSYLYKKEGLLASTALVLYTIITLAIFKIFSVTLTLAGIAGFILSVGMAVDANILIFERMREELRHGKSRESSARLGFTRAWTSIRDSNFSSLITCAILFYFGSGIIRGFAITLAIGIIVSMFSAITITRSLLRVFEKNERI